MKDAVINFLESILPISDNLKEWLLKNLKEKILSKKEIYLNIGETSNKISFILQGLLRSYYRRRFRYHRPVHERG
jgi:hypothetical protein